MAKQVNKQTGVRMGLKSAIKRVKRLQAKKVVKKAGMDASVGPTPAPTPTLPKINPTSYFRSKKKKKKDTPSPGLTLMPTSGATMTAMSPGATVKSEVLEEFKPAFVDIKELVKTSPILALSCMSIETLAKQNSLYDRASSSILNSFGGTKTDPPKTAEKPAEASSSGKSMTESINRAGASTNAGGGNVPKTAMGKVEPSVASKYINPKLLSTSPTHTLNGQKVKHLHTVKTDKGQVHVVEHMEGEHKGKWTQAGDSELKPLSQEMGKTAMPTGAKGPASSMPKGPKMAPPKAAPSSTPKPPKGPNVQLKPSGMGAGMMGKEEMGKGDVVRIKDKKVISTDTKPASPLRTGQQHKASKYTPMKPAAIREDGTRKKTPVILTMKEEKGKDFKMPEGVRTGKAGNWPVKEQGKKKGNEILNMIPEEGTEKKEDCYKPSKMIKEELAEKWEPKFKKPK